MRIYESLDEMPLITDHYIFNWECRNRGCWHGPCFAQHEKAPRACPGYGRTLIDGPTPDWKAIEGSEVKEE